MLILETSAVGVIYSITKFGLIKAETKLTGKGQIYSTRSNMQL